MEQHGFQCGITNGAHLKVNDKHFGLTILGDLREWQFSKNIPLSCSILSCRAQCNVVWAPAQVSSATLESKLNNVIAIDFAKVETV